MNSVAPVKAGSREAILQAAEAWFNRQLQTIEKSLGSAWPAHREWVEGYLREEIRQRLIARGWRRRS